MKRLLTALIALVMVASFSSVSWAIIVPFSQDTGFDTTAGNLLSTDVGDAQNDIRWNTTVPAVPGDLPGDYSVVSPTTPYFNTIAWGVANNAGGLGPNHWGDEDYSALRVVGYAGDATTGEWSTITRLYHQNNILNSYLATLASGIIHSTLTVGTADIDNIAFDFLETFNDSSCEGPGGLGSCPDVFTFNALGFADVYFVHGGRSYLAEFQLANFVDSALTTEGPIWSLWTAEGVTSSVDVQMKLTPNVPEPASMLLFGFGMIGAFLRRKFS